MRTVSKKTCDVLNDLIKINNDRVEGYTKASDEAKDNAVNLVVTFQNMIEQSRIYITDLGNLVTKYGGTLADGSTAMGKIYRTWMDLQINFSVDDRKNILNACEFGEDAAQKAYRKALEELELGEEARSLIAMQKNALKDSHDLIKSYRDRARVHA
jgi:uncharacterized protein (TIGR02284 family)